MAEAKRVVLLHCGARWKGSKQPEGGRGFNFKPGIRAPNCRFLETIIWQCSFSFHPISKYGPHVGEGVALERCGEYRVGKKEELDY